MACLSGLWWWTGRPVYRDLMRFWIRIFALGFGMGVVTGMVLPLRDRNQLGGFSRSVSNVLGPMFMYEAMTAFFLEAGFIGIVLFGEGRVGKGMHFFACCMVAGGALRQRNLDHGGKFLDADARRVRCDAEGIFRASTGGRSVFNPSFPFRLAAHGLRQLPDRWVRGRRRLGLASMARSAYETARKALSWPCGWRWSWRRSRWCWVTCTV